MAKSIEEVQNVFAFNMEFKEIHISEAVSGRQGYFCLGCKQVMQAVKTQIPNRMSYFRHDHNASIGIKCTYSDETYRHRLAKEILIQNKYVKVPSIIKYAPENSSGKPMLISESKMIYAKNARSEVIVYENDYGEIVWGKMDQDKDKMHLFIRPDVVFFDENDNPLLIIEIVATHKVDYDKSVILKRLGIDAVSISIPKGTPEEIEHTFKTVTRTKWLYNYEHDKTEYIQDANSNCEGIPTIDDEQRKLLNESPKCRTTQINNLIRSIRKCLDTEQFKSASRSIESEILRAENNTERERNDFEQKELELERRVEELQDEIRKSVTRKYIERRAIIDSTKRTIEFEEKSVAKEQENLAREQRKSNQEYREGCRKRIGSNLAEKHRSTIDKTKTRRVDLEGRYRRAKADGFSTIRREKLLIGKLKRDTENYFRQIENIETDCERGRKSIEEERTLEESLNRRIKAERNKVDTLEGRIENIRIRKHQLREEQERISSDIERNRVAEKLRNKESSGTGDSKKENRSDYDIEFSRILNTRMYEVEIFSSIEQAKSNNRRIKKAVECFRTGAYKNWIK